MWFKNLQVFRFTKPFELNATELGEILEANAFKPCGSQEQSGFGWVMPLGRAGTEYIHTANGFIMVCAKRQEKILPAGVINEKLDEKVQVLEEQEARKLTRKEREDIKEEIRFELLPRAFSRSSLQFAFIAPKQGLMVVDSASIKKAEELLTALREAIGTLAVVPLTTKTIPLQAMTHWLQHTQPPENFMFGNECELKELQDEGGTIRCKHQDLLADEINSHLKAGMSVTKLELHWQDKLSCIVDENLSIKRLKFSDMIQEQADNENAESAAEQFDVDFALMTGELVQFLDHLTQAFGGEDSAAYENRLQEQLVRAENEARSDLEAAGVEEL